MSKNKKIKGVKTPSRRKFFKAAAATGAAAAATVAMPNIALGAPMTLKMQAAWPSGANIFFEMAKDYCNMVSDMSGGELKNRSSTSWRYRKNFRSWTSSKFRRS